MVDEMVSDAALVAAARRGDDRAFARLVERHGPAVWRLARALLGTDPDAEEAVQDTFVRAHRSLASFRGDAALGTWLHSICRNVCIDRLRRRRVDMVPLAHHDRPAPGADALAGFSDLVDALPTDEREAFVLVDVLGYSREEVAVLIGRPSSTVRSRVARARDRLAESLTADPQV